MEEKILFSKKEAKSVHDALIWLVDECDALLSDSSMIDIQRIHVLSVRNYWCGIIRKLDIVLNCAL